MADYWVCSECENECEVVDITLDQSGDFRSSCCGALPEYRSMDMNEDWDPQRDWDQERDVDY